MAEVGRAAVSDPGSLLPEGFWAAVAVWVERPQVANKRLCGARLEARRSASLPRAEARGPRGAWDPAAAAPLLAGAPGQRDQAEAEEGHFPAPDLDSIWNYFSQSLAGDDREMLNFLTGSEAASQQEAQRELVLILRTIIPKASPRCPLGAARREMVVQDVRGGMVTFLPLEEDVDGNLRVKRSSVYQVQLSRTEGEW
uniref:tRNA (uracil-O(2)-)-methyltransferase n=1 Tax=Sus scrofa TaxID=9823 RepID=A0A8D0TWK1_PIG